jgi:acyl-CoA synthetase (AMP-forming)/AMP-acid ligase II
MIENSTLTQPFLRCDSTLVDLLHQRAQDQPEQEAFIFLKDGEIESGRLTYQQVDYQARAIAAKLQSLVSAGERALLLYPPGLEFITAFLGCLYAGVLAVPAYPPRRNQSISRLQSIASDSQATVALTVLSLLKDVEERLSEHSELASMNFLATDSISNNLASDWQQPSIEGYCRSTPKSD